MQIFKKVVTAVTQQQSLAGSSSQESLETRLDNMDGDFATIVPLFVEGSIRHADQITNARWAEADQDGSVFRTNQSISTADIALYVLKGGIPMLYLGRGYDSGKVINPFLNRPDRVSMVIGKKHDTIQAMDPVRLSRLERMDEEYNPTRAEIIGIRVSDDTLRVRLSDVVTNIVRVGYDGDRYANLEIDTKTQEAMIREGFSKDGKRIPLNAAQRAVAERVFGQGAGYQRTMERLNSAGIKSVRLTFLQPGYVEQHAQRNPIANDCWISDANLNELNLHYDFHATGNSPFGRLIGEPKVDYGPFRSMLMSRDFSPTMLGEVLSQASIANITEALEQFLRISIGNHPNYWRHNSQLPPTEINYQLLEQALSSPEWPLRMEGNLTNRMASNLFMAYSNAFSLRAANSGPKT